MNIQFAYDNGQMSAPINSDWAIELGLFDCPAHEVDENLYPLRCQGSPNSDPNATTLVRADQSTGSGSPLVAQPGASNPLLDTSAPAVGGGSLSLLPWVLALFAAGALAYRFIPRSAPRD